MRLISDGHLHGDPQELLVNSSYMCYGFTIVIVGCPDSYFIPFCADVYHSSAHVVAVVVKGHSNKTQEFKHQRAESSIQFRLIGDVHTGPEYVAPK